MKKKILFINRDRTLIKAPPVTPQYINITQRSSESDQTSELLVLLPGVIRNLYFIQKNLDFELVMITHQDGSALSTYPKEIVNRVQNKMLDIFAGEGIVFDHVQILNENVETYKPQTDWISPYQTGAYDLANSFVIGGHESDMLLAQNLGCKGIILSSWDQIKEFLFAGERVSTVSRTTKETAVFVQINVDGNGVCDISTGIGFFNHMLDQIGKHSGIDLTITVTGDLNVDEHHTVEDTAIALGEAIHQALGSKRGIERYGFCLPMDDCLCQVALDFGGRSWFVWDAKFHREKIGDMPTELFSHFFKSFSDAAKMNLHIKAEGENEHHKIEGTFKAFARALKMAIRRDVQNFELPSTKGVL